MSPDADGDSGRPQKDAGFWAAGNKTPKALEQALRSPSLPHSLYLSLDTQHSATLVHCGMPIFSVMDLPMIKRLPAVPKVMSGREVPRPGSGTTSNSCSSLQILVFPAGPFSSFSGMRSVTSLKCRHQQWSSGQDTREQTTQNGADTQDLASMDL